MENNVDFFKFNPRIVCEQEDDCVSRIRLEGLGHSMAHTVCNLVRRVLLSNTLGVAPVAILIDGIEHWCSPISGVVEDAPALICNIRKVSAKILNNQAKGTLRINTDKEGPVYAKDFEAHGLEVLSGDTYICSVSPGHSFSAMIDFEAGIGYRPVKHDETLSNIINLDANFSPIVSVAYKILEDSATVTIKTNGTVTGHKALKDALQYSIHYLSTLSNIEHVITDQALDDHTDVINSTAAINDKNDKERVLFEILFTKIDDLGLSIRSENCVKNDNIFCIGELVQRSESEMLRISNFGKKSLDEIKLALSKIDVGYGISLKFGMIIEGWDSESVQKRLAELKDAANNDL